MRSRRVAARAALAMSVLAPLLWVTGPVGSPPPAEAETPDERPNLVLIYTDDQTVAQMQALPQTRALLGAEGITFTNSVVTYPLCCPSRANLLTGQYTQNNGVRSNLTANDRNPLPSRTAASGLEAWPAFANDAERRTIAVALQQAGYHTGLLGKYMNGYNPRRGVPPGWSDWRAGRDNPSNDYWNTLLNVNGDRVTFAEEFQTDLYATQASQMIERAVDTAQPFFLMFSFSAPHTARNNRPIFANRHAGLYRHARAPRVPGFNERDMSDKPRFLRSLYPRMNRAAIQRVDRDWRNSLRSLASVDEAVTSIAQDLAEHGELDNTVIVFTSDNGFFYGEHRVPRGKYLPYEPSVAVPLIIRSPTIPLTSRGTETHDPVVNIDLAATFLDLAGAEPLGRLDGRSLVPLLNDPSSSWQDTCSQTSSSTGCIRPIYLMGVGVPQRSQVTYSGVRSGDGWVYIRWEDRNRSRELYDLDRDPFQLHNLAGQRRHRGVERRLERQRRLLVRCAGASCDVPPHGFLDLPRSGRVGWRDSAMWAQETGLGVAFGDGSLRPGQAIRRQHLVSWLWRAAGEPGGFDPHGLRDVPPWVEPAVRWAVAQRIIKDRPQGFGAREPLTRKLALEWLWRAAGRPIGFGPHHFDDVGASNRALRWADATGLLRTSSRRFSPARPLTRSGAVIWVHRSQSPGDPPG